MKSDKDYRKEFLDKYQKRMNKDLDFEIFVYGMDQILGRKNVSYKKHFEELEKAIQEKYYKDKNLEKYGI